ncbi:hypothetical protein [Litchfieldella qijiaojingensis]|nr:hypothetical protein [Halomonas qijiaojingensis]
MRTHLVSLSMALLGSTVCEAISFRGSAMDRADSIGKDVYALSGRPGEATRV